MSYILDALKKSEKERQQGKVPDLMTVQDVMAEEPKKRLLWPYLLLVSLLLNAGLLLWWLVPWQSKRPNVVAHSTAGQQLESKTAGSPSFRLAETVSPGVKATEEGAVPRPPAKPKNIAQQNQQLKATSVLQGRAPGKPMPTIDTSISSSVLQQTPVVSRVPSEPKPYNKIYNLDELPSSVRQNLPTFIISVSLYSDDPAYRMAKINGQMMREGEYLTAGLKLEEITPNGVIFSYQNYRFHVGMK